MSKEAREWLSALRSSAKHVGGKNRPANELRNGLSVTERAVLECLVRHADENGACFPGRRRIAEFTGISVATVKRTLDLLYRRQLVRVEYRIEDRGQTSNLYRLNLNKKTATLEVDPPAHSEPPPGSLCAAPPAHGEPQILTLNKSINKKKDLGTEVDSALEPAKASAGEGREGSIEKSDCVGSVKAKTEPTIVPKRNGKSDAKVWAPHGGRPAIDHIKETVLGRLGISVAAATPVTVGERIPVATQVIKRAERLGVPAHAMAEQVNADLTVEHPTAAFKYRAAKWLVNHFSQYGPLNFKLALSAMEGGPDFNTVLNLRLLYEQNEIERQSELNH